MVWQSGLKASGLRASDADREQVAERLRTAAAEGRLSADELEQRLSAAFRARTYGELDGLVADLPAPALVPRPTSSPDPFLRTLKSAIVLIVLVPFIVPMLVAGLVGALVVGHGVVSGFLPVWLVWLTIGWLLMRRRRRRGYAGAYDARRMRGGDVHGLRGPGRRGPGFWV